MSTNERNTHFANFAQALARELAEAHVFYDVTGQGQLILVRRAYDLAVNILMNAPTSSLQHCCSRFEAQECIESIPDMPKLPETEG